MALATVLALAHAAAVGLVACSTLQPTINIPRASVPAMSGPVDDDDGSAIFRPYQPGEEEQTVVPDSSKRLFALVLGLPTLALLLGIATYNPTPEELAQEQLRKATRLRGGATTSGR